MANIFAITTPAEDMKADAGGKASAIFTVTNTSHKPVRGIARARALGNTENDWLDLEGETERDFAAGGTQQFTVNFSKSLDAPAGKFPFRLDVASSNNPDEEFTEGPTVNVQTAPQAQLIKKAGFPWWIIPVIALLLLLIAGAVWFFAFRGDSDNSNVNINQPVNSNRTKVKATPTPGPDLEGTWVRIEKPVKEENFKELDIQKEDDKTYIVTFFADSGDDNMGPFKGTLTSAGALEGEGEHTIVKIKFNLKLTGSDQLTMRLVITEKRSGSEGRTHNFKQVFVRENANNNQPAPTATVSSTPIQGVNRVTTPATPGSSTPPAVVNRPAAVVNRPALRNAN